MLAIVIIAALLFVMTMIGSMNSDLMETQVVTRANNVAAQYEQHIQAAVAHCKSTTCADNAVIPEASVKAKLPLASQASSTFQSSTSGYVALMGAVGGEKHVLSYYKRGIRSEDPEVLNKVARDLKANLPPGYKVGFTTSVSDTSKWKVDDVTINRTFASGQTLPQNMLVVIKKF